MDKRRNREAIQNALNAALSGLEDDSWLAQRVLAEASGKKKVRRKLSVGVVLAFVLILAVVTAVAISLLSGQELLEEVVVPMAQGNDTEGYNESFSGSELEEIIRLAEENGISIEKQLEQALESGRGYYEEETIMAIAREAFGGYYYEWTIEQKHWFGEMMVRIGFREENPACLPGEGELSYEQAMAIVGDRILEEYGDDVTDTSRWRCSVDYETGWDEQGNTTPPKWYVSLTPVHVGSSRYTVTMDASGRIEAFEVVSISAESSADAVVEQYQSVYGGYTSWNYETWASLGNALRGRWADTRRCWAFQNAGFMLPPENSITEEQAREIALSAVQLEYTVADNPICCMDGETPIWKVETKTKRPEDSGSGMYSAIWLVEIDCMTGEVREKREFVVGSDMDSLLRWIPFHVLQSLPPMPEGPNG